MFLLPLVLALIAGWMGYNAGKGRKDPLRIGPGTKIGETWHSEMWRPHQQFQAPKQVQGSVRYRELLARVLQRGMDPSRGLLEAAYNEAQMFGDEESIQAILNLVCPVPAASEKQTAPSNEDEEPSEFDLSEYEPANPDTMPADMNSPLPGVDPQEWATFCGALKTREPDWSNERYVGCFEHNRARLRSLGIEDTALTDEGAQLQALATDIADHFKDSAKLVQDFAGDIINIDGQPTPVTMSGILGLLKAAGPKGAESWLRNENDRARFPRTTQTFLRTNNCF